MERMGTLSSNLRAVVELQASKEIDLEQPLFSIPLPMVHFGMLCVLYKARELVFL